MMAMDGQSTINIANAIDDFLHGKTKAFPQHVNRISSLDDPCLRRLYYSRHDWDKATPVSPRLQGIFETGKLLEPVIERVISEIGHTAKPAWGIVGSQTPTKDNLFKQYQISGSIDGFLQTYDAANDTWETQGVIDIKTASPNIYPRINSLADLDQYGWTRKYRGQLMLYALGHNLSKCFILFVNKANLYEMKFVEFEIDMAYCESLLSKAETINNAIEAETPPEGINEADECLNCRFFSFCCPPISMGDSISIEDQEELENIIDAMQEYETMYKLYEDLKKQRDSILDKFQGKNIVCGKWMILWKLIKVNYKPRPARTVEQWRKKIISTSPQKETSDNDQ